MENQENLLTVRELAHALRVHESWIYLHTRKKGGDTIPKIRVGRYLRFKLPDVMNWLKKQDGAKNGGEGDKAFSKKEQDPARGH
jgi:excisionase family DNA binding protein